MDKLLSFFSFLVFCLIMHYTESGFYTSGLEYSCRPIPQILLNGGGLSSQSPFERLTSFEVYHPSKPTNNRLLNVQMLKGLEGSVSARVDEETVIIAGGSDGRIRTSETQLYDIKWNTVAVGPSMSSVRGYSAIASLNNTVFVCGGQNLETKVLNTCEKLVSDQRPQWEPVASMNFETHAFAMVQLNGYLYAMGGKRVETLWSKLSRYNPATDTWHSLSPMKTARYGLAAAALYGKIYACGGRVDFDNYFSLCEKYDPFTNQWTDVASMTTNRYQLNLVAFNQKLLALGGKNKDHNAVMSVESYDPFVNKWTMEEPLKVERAYSGVVVFV